MIIYIDESKHSESEIDDLLNNHQIEYTKFDNEYMAVCREEIEQAIDCSDSFREDITFYDEMGDKANDIIWELSKELYESKEANGAFQELAETAQLIVNRKLSTLRENS